MTFFNNSWIECSEIDYLLTHFLKNQNKISAVSCNITHYFFVKNQSTKELIKLFSGCLVPINKIEKHYILVTLNLKTKKYYYLDPMTKSNRLHKKAIFDQIFDIANSDNNLK